MSKDSEEFFDYGYNSNQEESDEQGTAYTELSYQELSDLCKEVKESIKNLTRYVREKAGQDNEDVKRGDVKRRGPISGRGVLDKRKENRGRSAKEVHDSEWDLFDNLIKNANKD